MHPILLCSITMFTIVLERSWYFWKRQSRNIDQDFKGIEEALNIDELKKAKDIAGSLSGPTAIILRLGLENCQEKHEITEERMAIAGEKIIREASKGLSLLALIPSISTLLGLLGTVIGLLMAFKKVALLQGNVSPALLASGIWVALITTAAGLLVALPALLAHHFLQNKMARLTFEMEYFGSRLLLHLKTRSQPKQAEIEKLAIKAQHAPSLRMIVPKGES